MVLMVVESKARPGCCDQTRHAPRALRRVSLRKWNHLTRETASTGAGTSLSEVVHRHPPSPASFTFSVSPGLSFLVKLVRSHSSPSPPGGHASSGRSKSKSIRRRRRPPPLHGDSRSPLDWSTSYQAGSSSSQSGESSSSEDEEEPQSYAQPQWIPSAPAMSAALSNGRSSLLSRKADSDASSRSSSPKLSGGRLPRSPDVKDLAPTPPPLPRRNSSPAPSSRGKQPAIVRPTRYLLPNTFCVTVPLPWGKRTLKASGDVRKAGENIALLGSLLFGIKRIWLGPDKDNWVALELAGIILLSIIYLIWTHLSYFSLPKALPARSPSRSRRYRSSSPMVHRKTTSIFNAFPIRKDDFGYVWMTVPKNYRNSTDDGVLTALLLAPLICTACFYTSSAKATYYATAPALPSNWLIEPPTVLTRAGAWTATQSLIRSRHALVQLSSLTSSLLLTHLYASRVYEGHCRSKKACVESERASVPRSEWTRSRLYITFAVLTTLAAVGAKVGFEHFGLGIWSDLSYLDVLCAGAFYQLVLYMAMRLAHHSLTLGELGLASFGAVILFMETFHVTLAKLRPNTTLYLKTFRHPTPLLFFQLALIPGTIFVGVLLAPLLYLSRHIAQRPLRKLRFPEEKQLHRRSLATGFYLGSALIIGGLLGMWMRWCLNGRDPWIWVFFYILNGKTRWTRPLLLAYWGTLILSSIAAWGRQLSRSRKYRHKAAFPPVTGMHTENTLYTNQPAASQPPPPPTPVFDGETRVDTDPLNINGNQPFGSPNLVPIFANGNVSVSTVATDILDAADKKLPTLGINARRKSFHAVVVLMFIPGIAIDPAFTHLALSVGFALFTFAEYLRYFAVYPLGASIHVFLTEFLDDKDSGTAIMSHFYLLTGCASSIWLEGHSNLLEYTGVLVLGIGDSLASIVGRRMGRTRWSSTSGKTLEGSAAFVVSVVASAWTLRLLGIVEPFSTARYTAAISMAAVLEAFSVQNDNLTIPWYAWSMLVLMGVH